MSYVRARCDLDASGDSVRPLDFASSLGLKNLGLNLYVFKQGQGFDFFHNHREQEEIYFCLEGSADLLIGGDDPECLQLQRGDVVRVEPRTPRAIGNKRAMRAVVLIAGACPHPYPAGLAHHDVIADVLSVGGEGTTGFESPDSLAGQDPTHLDDEDC